MKTKIYGFMLCVVLCTTLSCSRKNAEKEIYYNAFSHNDYTRERPLADAMELGFNCVEADLHLIDGKLYVAHDYPQDMTGVKQFEKLYIAPLYQEFRKNGGKIYPGSKSPFLLMVDFKEHGDSCYAVLKPILERYKEMLCALDHGTYREGAVLLFFSGSRPLETLPAETSRMAFLDGKIEDLGQDIPASLMPVVSDNYGAFFTWNGEGKMPQEELDTLRSILAQTHKEGKKLRFWGAPDTKDYKQMLLEEGVDLVGTDNLKELYEMLKSQPSNKE